MRQIDALAVCPYYIRIRDRCISCEPLEDGAAQILRFKSPIESHKYFLNRCAAYTYAACPYSKALDAKYADIV